MTDVQFVDHMTVLTTRVEGSDEDIARAAWVSTKGQRVEEGEPERVAGLINMLLRDRHGSPFEQVGLQFLTTAPIFVWREHMRHRIASYNEESGRYRQLDPVFYIPGPDRPLRQQGKPGAYEMLPGTEGQHADLTRMKGSCEDSYEIYEWLLNGGMAKEVARMALPLNIMSTAYVRMNLRALMNFLSLRTKDEGARFPSFPQREIEMVAEEYEVAFAENFPLAYHAFQQNGRVAP